MKVRPDVVTLERSFDYLVPDKWREDGRAELIAVGSIVRVDLAGRRVGGWVTEINPETNASKLSPLQVLTGMGPPPEIIDLAKWAAWRWAGSEVHFLRAASPKRAIRRLPKINQATQTAPQFDTGITTLQLPPNDDGIDIALQAAQTGQALIVVPSLWEANRFAKAFRQKKIPVALGNDDWALAAAGATVIGAKSAVWLPMPNLTAVVVIDEHAEVHQSEKTPTYNARDVALERARRAGATAVLVSPIPSLEAQQLATPKSPTRASERSGWPLTHVLDRRKDDPTHAGLLSSDLRRHLDTPGTILAIVNRKGRSRLMACKDCGQLVRSSDGQTPMILNDDELYTPDGSETRPVVCADCGSTTLKNLRMGVTRVVKDLTAFVGEPVTEITATTKLSKNLSPRIFVGTEAALWRFDSAAVVVFLDFDQELLAIRQRSAPQALALLARAARLLMRNNPAGSLIIQTRQPDHPVLTAALKGDPRIVSNLEREKCQTLNLPPFGAQARISGIGAPDFIDSLKKNLTTDSDMKILGPANDSYLIRAPDHQTLLDALAAPPRPTTRLRIEVDPLRI